MRLYTITINNRVYQTTEAVKAWFFASIFSADRMNSIPHSGRPMPLLMFMYEIPIA